MHKYEFVLLFKYTVVNEFYDVTFTERLFIFDDHFEWMTAFSYYKPCFTNIVYEIMYGWVLLETTEMFAYSKYNGLAKICIKKGYTLSLIHIY